MDAEDDDEDDKQHNDDDDESLFSAPYKKGAGVPSCCILTTQAMNLANDTKDAPSTRRTHTATQTTPRRGTDENSNTFNMSNDYKFPTLPTHPSHPSITQNVTGYSKY